jgi:hypothetical protein
MQQQKFVTKMRGSSLKLRKMSRDDMSMDWNLPDQWVMVNGHMYIGGSRFFANRSQVCVLQKDFKMFVINDERTFCTWQKNLDHFSCLGVLTVDRND